ncbi:MAG: hypothetical protein MI922_23415, partial [Bacteroidales bacterium]|nr:hypothetical protein [Bacteroidales bacterium]
NESSLDIFENCYELGDGYIFEIQANQAGLNIWESWSNSEYTVYPINDSSFIDSTGVVQFDFYNISNGTAKKLDVIYNGDKSTAVLDHKTPTNSLLLMELSGFYYCNDLNTVYHFFRNEETLFVRIGDEIPRKVLVMNKNLLSFSGYEAIVKRDEENKISGFELTNQQSSRNNIFVKISPRIN